MISEAKIRLWIVAFLFLWGCSKAPKPAHLVGQTMGTTYSVKYIPNNKTPKITLVNHNINKLLIEVNRQMSTYIPTSEISVFNKTVSADTPYKVSEDLFKVLAFSLEVSKLTKGQFDPTIGPLVNLWGFGPTGERKVPSQKLIEEAKNKVGYAKLMINQSDLTISKKVQDLYLDLSASAKGFGVDKVSEYLEGIGIENYMVEIGGEVRTRGSKNGKLWKIAIESPHPTDTTKPFQKILSLKNNAVATSGNYRNFFESNGKKYGHTIDFRTGGPTTHTLASVTVVNQDSCMSADAWATALMVMGMPKGLEFAESLGLLAYFIYRETGQKEGSFVEVATSHFETAFGKLKK